MSASTSRTPDHEIDPICIERWSPRAFDGAMVELSALMQMFEAARWAPSS